MISSVKINQAAGQVHSHIDHVFVFIYAIKN